MASSRTAEREEERRFNLRTLVIASSASATAAVVTSQLWIAGTWIAAAATPILVALISELLHRPTEKIADRYAASRHSRGEAEPPLVTRETEPAPAARETGPPPTTRPAAPGEAPVRLYRTARPATLPRRRIAIGTVLATGLAALAIAFVVITVPEVIAGGAIGDSSRKGTFLTRDKSPSSSDQDDATRTEGGQERSEPNTTPTDTESDQTTPTEPPPAETTPTTPTPPEETAPADTAPAPATPPAEP